MRWTIKARVQKAISLLPTRASYEIYYRIQRKFGGLKAADPVSRLRAGIEIARLIRDSDKSIDGSHVLEVGTGAQLNVPIALWLAGSRRVTTVDLNPYLRWQLVRDDLAYIRIHRASIRELFASVVDVPELDERLQFLCDWQGTDLDQLLSDLAIDYLAPADASLLDYAPQTFDYHVSYSVLEHIPPESLYSVLLEGARVVKQSGLLVHCIDFSDHYSHDDGEITAVNFLQFDEKAWASYAANRFAYHNRLRVDEFMALVGRVGLQVLTSDVQIGERARTLLERNQLRLAPRFLDKAPEVNAAQTAWVVCSPPPILP
jgi:hypothetical protein